MATQETRAQVIDRIEEAWRQDNRLVVVVSAMGRRGAPYATDTLLDLVAAGTISDRERDLLLTCGETIAAVVLSAELNARGVPAEALSGAGAGIVTSNAFGQAEVLEVHPEWVHALWEAGRLPIVAGFQGETVHHQPTTLGRGGSDTSAVVLGAALGCPVDIYTDVPGIFTADPRIVQTASVLPEVEYHEVLELAVAGAKVIHPRAVSEALSHSVPVRVLSTFDGAPGTIIGNRTRRPEAPRAVTGIAHQTDLLALEVHAAESGPVHHVLERISGAGITIDMINLFGRDFYCVVQARHRGALEELLAGLPIQFELKAPVTKVTVVGESISDWPGVMARITEALAARGIPILQTSDSLYTISLLVEGRDGTAAVNALHDLFQLSGGRSASSGSTEVGA